MPHILFTVLYSAISAFAYHCHLQRITNQREMLFKPQGASGLSDLSPTNLWTRKGGKRAFYRDVISVMTSAYKETKLSLMLIPLNTGTVKSSVLNTKWLRYDIAAFMKWKTSSKYPSQAENYDHICKIYVHIYGRNNMEI